MLIFVVSNFEFECMFLLLLAMTIFEEKGIYVKTFTEFCCLTLIDEYTVIGTPFRDHSVRSGV